jgi:chaperone modulatory protein CbpM
MDPNDDARREPGLVPEEPPELTLTEVCGVCAVQTEFVVELVAEGVLAPAGQQPDAWRFTYAHVQRVRVASRLQHDLGVNTAGIALALELMEEIEALRARLEAPGGGPAEA